MWYADVMRAAKVIATKNRRAQGTTCIEARHRGILSFGATEGVLTKEGNNGDRPQGASISAVPLRVQEEDALAAL